MCGSDLRLHKICHLYTYTINMLKSTQNIYRENPTVSTCRLRRSLLTFHCIEIMSIGITKFEFFKWYDKKKCQLPIRVNHLGDGQTRTIRCGLLCDFSATSAPLKCFEGVRQGGLLQVFCLRIINKGLRIIFNFIKFYSSGLKVLYSLIGPGNGNLIHIDIIFAAPKLVFTNALSPLIMNSLKNRPHR